MRTFTGWGSTVGTVSWYPDAGLVAAAHGGYGDSIRVYSTEDGSEKLRIEATEPDNGFGSAAVSPDGRMVAAISSGGRYVTIWDGVFGTLFDRLESLQEVRSLEWCPGRSGVLAAAGSEGVQVWDVLSLHHQVLSLLRLGETAGCVAWSPDGNMLAVGLSSRVEIWSPWRPALLVSAPTWNVVLSLAWSPDGFHLACLSLFNREYDDGKALPVSCRGTSGIGKVTIWDTAATYSQPTTLLNLSLVGDALIPINWRPWSASGHSSMPMLLDWAPNSTKLAAGRREREFSQWFLDPGGCHLISETGVAVWRIGTGGPVSVLNLTGPVRPVSSVSWSPDGSRIAAGSDDGCIRIWRVGPSEPVPESLAEARQALMVLFFVIGLVLLRPHIKD